MQLTVNKESIEFNGKTIVDLMNSQNKRLNSGLVVAVNDEIILKSQWEKFELNEFDRIFIVIPAEGG